MLMRGIIHMEYAEFLGAEQDDDNDDTNDGYSNLAADSVRATALRPSIALMTYISRTAWRCEKPDRAGDGADDPYPA